MVPHRPYLHNTNLSVQGMIHKRNLTFEHSFQEIKSKASPEQRKYIFENLAILQNNFRSNHTNIKRGHPLQEYADKTTSLHEETGCLPKLAYMHIKIYAYKYMLFLCVFF
jgi:hypothetical protein